MLNRCLTGTAGPLDIFEGIGQFATVASSSTKRSLKTRGISASAIASGYADLACSLAAEFMIAPPHRLEMAARGERPGGVWERDWFRTQAPRESDLYSRSPPNGTR